MEEAKGVVSSRWGDSACIQDAFHCEVPQIYESRYLILSVAYCAGKKGGFLGMEESSLKSRKMVFLWMRG